jgi:ankyrin repeat protein
VLACERAKAGLLVVDEVGGTALTTAIRGNHSGIATLLLHLGADPNDVYTDEKVSQSVKYPPPLPFFLPFSDNYDINTAITLL